MDFAGGQRGIVAWVAIIFLGVSAPFQNETAPTAPFVLEPSIVARRLDSPLTTQGIPVTPNFVKPDMPLQCAIYARIRSGIDIRGAARTWWRQAQTRYLTSSSPREGAVLVLSGTKWGHVGVVSKVVSPTEILMDHANWMHRGKIQLNALVRDVSEGNDWSSVRVWHPPSNDLGRKAYPVLGFILPERIPLGYFD